MTDWEAPAKINLSLEVGKPDETGFHPIHSLVQAIDWCDRLVFEVAELEDRLTVVGAELPEGSGNLVWKAVAAFIDDSDRPPLQITLDKRIPVAAGLGGGSSDAAAALSAIAHLCGTGRKVTIESAATVGSDVPFFLEGGTAVMEGRGERLTRLDPLNGFVLVVAVPPFELATGAVYQRWDELDFPQGSGFPSHRLPPALRVERPLRNDLVGAALDLHPELGDWMSDLGAAWNRPVAMSGSGPSVFGFFADSDEAETALPAIPVPVRSASVARLRDLGVRRIAG